MAGTVTFSAPVVSLTQSNSVQTGFFDVVVTDSAAGADQFQGFGVQVNSSDALVTFIAADTNTTGQCSFFRSLRWQLSGNAGFNQQTPNDEYNTDVPANNTGPFLTTSALGLMRVEYSIPANYLGSFELDDHHRSGQSVRGLLE